MASTNGMRSPMMTGTRRSAKQTVTDFVSQAIKTLEHLDIAPSRREHLIVQLRAMERIARQMGWTDLQKRISRVTIIS